MGNAQYEVLSAALALNDFTAQELSEYSGLSIATVQTTLSRNSHFFESLSVERTGRKGGRPIRRGVRASKRSELMKWLEAALPRRLSERAKEQPAALTLVFEALDVLDAYPIGDCNRGDLIAFCQRKITSAEDIARLRQSGSELQNSIEAAKHRLDCHVLNDNDIERLLKELQIAVLDGRGNRNCARSWLIIFDFISTKMDLVTEKVLEHLRKIGMPALMVPMEGRQSIEDTKKVIDRTQAVLAAIGKPHVGMGMLATFDSSVQPTLAGEWASEFLWFPRRMSRNPTLTAVVDQGVSSEAQAKTLSQGGIYIGDAACQPLGDILANQMMLRG